MYSNYISGTSLFSEEIYQLRILALLNSKVAMELLRIAPTLNFQPGDINKVIYLKNIDNNKEIELLSKENIQLSKQDWNSFEESWEFKNHPLL